MCDTGRRPLIWDHYLAVRYAVYRIPTALPYRRQLLTELECKAVESAMEAIAEGLRRPGETVGAAIARVVPRALRYWMQHRPGRENYLLRERHPIHELPRDLDWLVAEMLQRASAQRATDPEAPSEPVQRDNVPTNAELASGARTLLAAIARADAA